MKDRRIYIIFILFILIFSSSCSNKASNDRLVENESIERLCRSAVLNYYNKKINNELSNYKEIKIYTEKNLNNKYFILSHLYQNVGQSTLDLFLFDRENGEYKSMKLAPGFEPISMGYSVNRVVQGNNTILFGKFNSSTWIINTDEMKEVNYAKVRVEFKDGEVIEEEVMHDEGYIIVANTVSEIDDIILYNYNGYIESSSKDISTYPGIEDVKLKSVE